MEHYSRVHAAIDLNAILHNVKQMRGIIGKDTQIMAVIKADGYGHGAVPIGRELERLPYIWGYAVATVEEGIHLRKHGMEKPVLILGAAFPEQYRDLVRYQLRPTIFSRKMAEDLSEALEAEVPIHVKIDTGLSRLGFQVTMDSAEAISQINHMKHIILEGIFTHFAKADDSDKAMARMQMAEFDKMQKMLQELGVTIPVHHISNSAGIIDMPYANMDIVRAGISLYGLWPSDEVNKKDLDLKPALSLKSRIVHLKELNAGRTVSYGATYIVRDTQTIATIPVGYGDGYPRSLSNKGYVLIRGKKAPICGRVCMDFFMADVTGIPDVSEGDEVILVGRSGEEEITMEGLGALSGRFNYEFACVLGKRIPRVYYKNGEEVDAKDYFGD